MSEEFINNLECKKVEPGDISILEALSRFDCGNTDSPYHDVSSRMLGRFKQYILGNSENLTDIYYIVWDCVDIFLFFSLQASLVFCTGLIEPEDVNALKTVYKWAKQADNNDYKDFPDRNTFNGLIDTFDKISRNYKRQDDGVINILKRIINCKTSDIQNNIYVERCIPSIEIVNFCKNHALREKWNSANISTPIGATLFWFKILPIIEEVSNQIGCVYVSLFAADVSTDETDDKRKLLSYYENALMFVKNEKLQALKPLYDWECIFLCQKISELCRKRESFKRNFLSGFTENDV